MKLIAKGNVILNLVKDLADDTGLRFFTAFRMTVKFIDNISG